MAAKISKKECTVIVEIAPAQSGIDPKVNRLWLNGDSLPTLDWSHQQWLGHLVQQGWSVVSANTTTNKEVTRIIYELRYQIEK
jgi:hypothetical protein